MQPHRHRAARAAVTALAGAACAAMLAGCAATLPSFPQGSVLAECQSHFLALDQMTDAAGVRDQGVHRVPGFPYLRSNRFLASFASSVDEAQFDTWVEQLRQLALQSLRSERANLGADGEAGGTGEWQRLEECGALLARADQEDAARRALLRKAVAVPDDYSRTQRWLGLYALAAPFLKLGVAVYAGGVEQRFEQAPAAASTTRVMWRLAQGASPSDSVSEPVMIARDALGVPRIESRQWWRLAALHAPPLWVETRGTYDLPGAVGLQDGRPVVDAMRPVVYFEPAYTRFDGRVLPQLVYTTWFARRPADGNWDPYAGELDGVVWRVTLDEGGRPLAWDTIHSCGCYHMMFAAQPLQPRAGGDFWQERVLMPQDPVPAAPVLALQSGTHYLERLVEAQATQGAEVREYRLADYRDLLSLPDGDRRRSLFGKDGLVCGTERLERFWLWPTGVRSPGAMRQSGRHATAFIGRRHFDDPFLLDRLFQKW